MYLLRFDRDDFVSLVKCEGSNVPQYAILSHTWGSDEDELNFVDIMMATGVYSAHATAEHGVVDYKLLTGRNYRLTDRMSAIKDRKSVV